MHKAMFILVAVVCFGVMGCSTQASYIDVPGAQYVEPSAQFTTGNITDSSGFQFAAGDADAFNLADAMKASLQTELSKYIDPSIPVQYFIDVDILRYEPGNAGLRWLMPGLGATELAVKATILDDSGNNYAVIPVERSIAAGGGFTVGAYKYVFEEVAKAIVELIKNPEKRTAPKNK